MDRRYLPQEGWLAYSMSEDFLHSLDNIIFTRIPLLGKGEGWYDSISVLFN